MKKLISILIICALFLTGCGNSVSNYSDEETKKKNRIEVYSAQDDTLVTTIDDQNTTNQILDSSDWEEAEQLPDDLNPEYKMLVYQEKTLLYGQDPDEEREYELIETLITYQDSPYTEEIISSDVIHNMIIPEDALTFCYVMPDEIQKELDEIINQ